MADAPSPPWTLGCPWCPFSLTVFARGAKRDDPGSGFEAATIMAGHVQEEHGKTWLECLRIIARVDKVEDLSLGLVHGDELLVDGSAYTGRGVEWAPLVHVSAGSASTYPYKVGLSNGAEGQYAWREIQDVRRPESVKARLLELERAQPGSIAAELERTRWPR